ncbi:MAG: helix-turn-helix domain-containing protein [Bacteroidota bacterium]
MSSKESGEKLSISRDDLAKMVGTASESVIRVLSEFKDEGLIEIESGRIKILHPAKLEKVVRWMLPVSKG